MLGKLKVELVDQFDLLSIDGAHMILHVISNKLQILFHLRQARLQIFGTLRYHDRIVVKATSAQPQFCWSIKTPQYEQQCA